MITVTTPATSYQLTTLESVVAIIGADALGCDDEINSYIERASGIICSSLDVPRAEDGTATLAQETLVERIQLDEPDSALMLGRYPVSSVTAITIDGVVIDPTEYLVRGAMGEVIYMDASGVRSDWPTTSIILVSYVGGWVLPSATSGRNLPYDIEDCCIRITQRLWYDRNRDPLLKSEQYVGILSYNYNDGPDGLYKDELDLIAKYRRFRS
jgi:hypothetical protein